MSRRGQGKRARSRRGEDASLDNTAWLEELERAAAEQDPDADEEEWASKLRRRRSRDPEPPPRPPDPQGRAQELPRAPANHDLSPYPPLGSEPPPPPRPAPGPAREPDYRPLGMEADTRRQDGDWDGGWDAGSSPRAGGSADWAPRDPAPGPSAAGDWAPRDPAPGSGTAGDWTGGDPAPGSGAAGGWAPRDPAPGPGTAEGGTAGWAPRDPAPPATGAGTDWSAWEPERGQEPPGPVGRDPVGRPGGSGEPRRPGGQAPVDRGLYDPGEPEWRPAGPDAATGAWSPAEPVGREPDYPALFGELNRRSAAQREALWDSPPAPAQEPYEDPGSPEPPAPAWPFDDTTGTWEPSDRSFIWPAEEAPATSSEWEPSTPSWLDEPTAQPPTWQATPADTAPPAASPVAPDDWAAGIQSGVPPAAPAGRAGDAAARHWRQDETVYAEPAVPLDANGMAPPRSAERIQMAEPADHWELYERPRARWPKVVAVVSWIVLLMVVCWFYVFPWLERVLPENF
jgi:hypothetical protein